MGCSSSTPVNDKSVKNPAATSGLKKATAINLYLDEPIVKDDEILNWNQMEIENYNDCVIGKGCFGIVVKSLI